VRRQYGALEEVLESLLTSPKTSAVREDIAPRTACENRLPEFIDERCGWMNSEGTGAAAFKRRDLRTVLQCPNAVRMRSCRCRFGECPWIAGLRTRCDRPAALEPAQLLRKSHPAAAPIDKFGSRFSTPNARAMSFANSGRLWRC